MLKRLNHWQEGLGVLKNKETKKRIKVLRNSLDFILEEIKKYKKVFIAKDRIYRTIDYGEGEQYSIGKSIKITEMGKRYVVSYRLILSVTEMMERDD